MRDACFAYIADVFSPVESEHLAATDGVVTSQNSPPPFSFEAFFDAVIERELCEHPESSGWYCVPLHKKDRPVLRDEYVVFTDHALRGKYVVLSSPDANGSPVTFRPEEFATLEIVEALRFWDQLFVSQGVGQAETFADTLQTGGPGQGLDSSNDHATRLNEGIAALDYAITVGEELSDVDISSLKTTHHDLCRRLKTLAETRLEQRRDAAIKEARERLNTADQLLEEDDFERAQSRYADGIELLEEFCRTQDIDPLSEDTIADVYQRLSNQRQAAIHAQQRETIDELRQNAADREAEAKTAANEDDFQAAISAFRAAKDTFEDARKLADFDPDLEAELATDIERVTDHIEEVQNERARRAITPKLNEARRWLQRGNEHTDSGSYEEAIEQYEQGIEVAISGVDQATEADVLVEEAETLRSELELHRNDADRERRRNEVDALVTDARDLLETGTNSQTGTDRAVSDLSEARRRLIEARRIASVTEGIPEKPIETLFDEITEQYRSVKTTQREEELREDIEEPDQLVERGEHLLENDDPTAAVQVLQEAKQQYQAVRGSLDERGMAAFDTRLRAHLASVNRMLRTAEQECKSLVTESLDAAETAVSRAKQHRDDGDFETAQAELRQALEHHQEAYMTASVVDSHHLDDIRQRFRRTESNIKSLRSIPAKLALHDCITTARECVSAGEDARDHGMETTARESYTDALSVLDEAISLVNDHDFGTTEEIERYNLAILRKNRRVIESRRASLEDGGSQVRPIADFEDVTDHLRPPDAPSSEDVDVEQPVASAQEPGERKPSVPTDDLNSGDILTAIESEFE